MLAFGCAAPRATSGTPEILIRNARLAGTGTTLQTIRIADGRVDSLGEAAEPSARTPAPRELDADGGLVLPGFQDAHVHLTSGGESLAGLGLAAAESEDDVARALSRFAAEHPSPEWILGRGWSYDIVPTGRLPRRAALDAVVPDRPVLLESYDGHALWANTRALALAGVGPDTPDPPDGTIVREPGSRTPTGVLLEGAGALVERAVPPPTHAQRLRTLERALEHLVRLGITAVDTFERDPDVFALFAELDAAGRLPLRVRVSLPLEGDLDAYAALRRQHDGPRLRFGFVKGFVDGVIESRTAYLLAPYAGSGGDAERGRPLLPPERLHALVAAAHHRGFPVALHAIGDAAVRLALDTYERVQADEPRADLSHRIEHIEVVDDADLPRFAALGVVASMQPFHANPFGDTPDAGVWSQNLGAARLGRTFAWRSLHRAGATLRFGSDWPVMSADPLQGLAVALTRRDALGRPAAGWNAHQTLDVDAALDAYARSERGDGAIRPGRPADLVVLAPDVDLARPESLWRGPRVRAVLVGGEVRFAAGAGVP